MADEETTDAVEAMQLLSSAKMAIETALQELEEANPDLEVTGFASRQFTFHAPSLAPQVIRTLPSLSPGLAADGDSGCVNILCEPGRY